MSKITITEIAKMAGVSIGTVSSVLNNKSNVSKKTRKKIQDLIKKHDYHPSRLAKNLALKSSNLIGAIIMEQHFSMDEPFYTKIYLSAIVETDKQNKHLLLSLVREKDCQNDDIQLPNFVNDKTIAGIITMGDIPIQYLKELANKKIPMAVVDYYSPDLENANFIMANNYMAGYIATKHLADLGHKKIACIADMCDHPSIEERIRGYEKILQENNIQLPEALLCRSQTYHPHNYGYEVGVKIAKKEIDVTAVFATNDSMAIGCIEALTENGIKVPEDVAIVGCDDIAAASQITPKLTTIRIPIKEMGVKAVNKLIASIDEKDHIPQMTTLPVKLIVRGSCGSQEKTQEKLNLI